MKVSVHKKGRGSDLVVLGIPALNISMTIFFSFSFWLFGSMKTGIELETNDIFQLQVKCSVVEGLLLTFIAC